MRYSRRAASRSLPTVLIIAALIVGLGSGTILTLATFGIAGTTTIVVTQTVTDGSVSYNYTDSIVRAASPTVSVSIQNIAFNPESITVVIGVNNTVVWTNYDETTHTVTDDNGTFNSGNLNGGQTWSYTFTTPGTYYYHCIYHSVMNGVVVVLA